MRLNKMTLSIKIPKFKDILINLLLLMSILSYEKIIHNNFYDISLIFIFGIGIILFIISITNRDLNKEYYNQLINNKSIHLLALSLLFSSFFSSISLSLLNFRNFINVILLIISLYIFYLLIPLLIRKNMQDFLDRLALTITLVSFIGIYIYLYGNLFNYYPMYYRAASFMFDPNFFGSFAAVGVILCMKKSKKFILLGSINLIALYYSGSRGALLSLILSILIGYLFNEKINFKKMIIYILLVAITIILAYGLYDSGFFRSYQGSSGRDNLLQVSFSLIKEQPLWGYGNFSIPFKSAGATNSGSHNSIIDFTLRYGLIPLIIYIFIIFKSFILGVKNKTPIRVSLVIILLSINMNTIVISLGGLGGLSLIYTLFLGLSNINKRRIL